MQQKQTILLYCFHWHVHLFKRKATPIGSVDEHSALKPTESVPFWEVGLYRSQIVPVKQTGLSDEHSDLKPMRQTGSYRGQIVFLKRLRKKQVELNRIIKKELQLMKEMDHDNINRFIGAVVEPGNICIVTQCCTRGSLQVCIFSRWSGKFVACACLNLILLSGFWEYSGERNW